MIKKAIIASLAALTLALSGCGADCESLCEDSKECPGADQSADCAKECAEMEQDVEAFGCTSEYDDFLSCSGDTDICSETEAEEKCKDEASKFIACIFAFCMTNPDNSACN